MSRPAAREIRVAPHIYQSPHGWRVYISKAGRLRAFRFPRTTTLAQLETWVAAFKEERERARRLAREADAQHRGTFAGDADRYLALKVVQAMPSYVDRCREIGYWVRAFGRRPRAALTVRELDEQLQAWRDAGAAASTVNKRRTALMSLYTRLDGRHAANPVRQTRVFEEPPAVARGVSYVLVRQLLEAMPADRSQPEKGVKGSRSRGNKTRARLAIMAWTGLTPAQIKQLTPRHVSLRERWYIAPPRGKGARRPRHPRPEIKKPLTPEARAAFARFVALGAWGDFDSRALRHALERARKKVERQRRKESRNNAIVIPPIRPYDLRHSFGTELYRRTGSLELVAEMLDHSSLTMTKRYALGAVPARLKVGMQAFARATRKGAR